MIVERRISQRRFQRCSFDELQKELMNDYLDEISLGRVQASPIDVYVYYIESTGDWKPSHVSMRIVPALRATKHKYVIRPPGCLKDKFINKNWPAGKYRLNLKDAIHYYNNMRRKEHGYLLMRMERCAKQLAIFEPREARHMLDEDQNERTRW